MDINPREIIDASLKMFIRNSYKRAEFEVYQNIIAKAKVNRNPSCPTMWVFFSKRVVIEWSDDFVFNSYKEIGKKFSSLSHKGRVSVLKEFIFLVLWHETLHVMMGHLAVDTAIIIKRCPEITPRECNIAADWQINTYIMDSYIYDNLDRETKEYFSTSCVALPEEIVNSYSLQEYKHRNYFDWISYILKNKHKAEFTKSLVKFSGDCHEIDTGEEGAPSTMLGSMDEEDLQKAVAEGESVVPEVEKTTEEKEKEQEQVASTNKYRENKAKSCGNRGSSDKTIEVTQEDVLVKLPPLVKETFEIGDSYYIIRRHKIEDPLSMVGIVGLKFPELKEDKVKKDVCLFCDVSGSMDANSLRFVLPVIQDVLRKHVGVIRVIYCDTQIKRDFVYHNPDDLDPWPYGGGTNFEHAFEKLYNDGIRDMICYTDGCFSYFDIPDDLKVMWLLVDGWGRRMPDMPGSKVLINDIKEGK